MSETEAPIRSTDDNEVIEANILVARENNDYERTLVTEAPEVEPFIRATEVPRDNEYRRGDTTPVGYSPSASERRRELEDEVAMGPYVGPIDGEGTDTEAQDTERRESFLGGRRDEDGNLLHDPGILPGDNPREYLPGVRDEDGNLIADHDGDGKASAKEGPIREAIGVGVGPEVDEDEAKGSRAETDADRDLDAVAEELEDDVAPEHDPDASIEDQIAGRGIDDRDLGDGEDAGVEPEYSEFLDDAEVSAEVESLDEVAGANRGASAVIGTAPGEGASAEEWRRFARDNNVEVAATANRASTKAALREAGLIK